MIDYFSSLRFFVGSIRTEAALGVIEIIITNGAIEFTEDIILFRGGYFRPGWFLALCFRGRDSDLSGSDDSVVVVGRIGLDADFEGKLFLDSHLSVFRPCWDFVFCLRVNVVGKGLVFLGWWGWLGWKLGIMGGWLSTSNLCEGLGSQILSSLSLGDRNRKAFDGRYNWSIHYSLWLFLLSWFFSNFLRLILWLFSGLLNFRLIYNCYGLNWFATFNGRFLTVLLLRWLAFNLWFLSLWLLLFIIFLILLLVFLILYWLLYLSWFKTHKIFNFILLLRCWCILLHIFFFILYIFFDKIRVYCYFLRFACNYSCWFRDLWKIVRNFAWKILRILLADDKFNINGGLFLDLLFSRRIFMSFGFRSLYFCKICCFWCIIYVFLCLYACILNLLLLFDLFFLELIGRFLERSFFFYILMDYCPNLLIVDILIGNIANFLCGLWSSNFLFTKFTLIRNFLTFGLINFLIQVFFFRLRLFFISFFQFLF